MQAVFEHSRVVVADDIDVMGHANNLAYLQWALTSAVEHSRLNGWTFERYQELGAGWVVRAHQITYLRSALEGDAVVVRTWISELGRATCRRRYEIERVVGLQRETLASAHTDWVFVDFRKQSPRRIPPELTTSFVVVVDTPQVSPVDGK
jgi:acyl-CoA thioester hydrolase